MELVGTKWKIQATPATTIKIKRWFSRVDVAAKTLSLSATPEICAELEWFCDRHPLECSEQDANELQRRAQQHRDTQESARKALSMTYARVPLRMAKPPRPYQDQAAELCFRLGGILCADELGLGKTITAIALMARHHMLPAVVVAPTNVLDQWERRIQEFLPHANTYVVRSAPGGESGAARRRRAEASVVILAYTRLKAWAQELQPRCLIFDEVHELRHAGTDKCLAAHEVRSKATACMGLSATPIFNYGGEFFNVLSVIQPGALGERDEFLREWCSSSNGNKPQIVNPEAFGEWLRSSGHMVRRSRRDVGRELPPLVRTVVDVPLDEGSYGESDSSMVDIAWRALYGEHREKFSARGELDMRLRQWTGLAKAGGVAGFVDELLLSSDEPVLLSGWHRSVYEVWMQKLARWNPVLYTGSETSRQKDANAQAVMRGDSKLLIMSLRSGQGLDGLQDACKRVVHGELDWSPQVHSQLTGRVHRDGQKDATMEYWCVADEGSDPVVLDTLGVKRWQSDAVIDPEGHRVLEIKTDPEAVRKLAEDYLRRRGLNPDCPPQQGSPSQSLT